MDFKTRFENLLQDVENGKDVQWARLLPYLALESEHDRVAVNTNLAIAFLKCRKLEQAKVFIERAWLISQFSEKILNIYIEIQTQNKDYDKVRDAYKLCGIKRAKERDFDKALVLFQLSQRAKAMMTKKDDYDYDFEILNELDNFAQPYKYTKFPWKETDKRSKWRVVYVLFGLTHINSAIVRLVYNIVKNHDLSKFEISIIAPDPTEAIEASPQGNKYIDMFREIGIYVYSCSSQGSREMQLRSVANLIYNFEPDILVFSTLLADLSHYYIAALHPAPVMIGHLSGPLPQFAAPVLDATISWSAAQAIESPCCSFLVPMEDDVKVRKQDYSVQRSDFSIPPNAIIIFMAGRRTKFQEIEIWKTIMEVIQDNESVFFIAIGVRKDELTFLKDLTIRSQVKEKMIILPFREDYFEILSLADIVVDTYPSGGGQTLIDAMSLQKPIISFEHDYSKPFDQASSWSVMGEWAASGRLKDEMLDLVLKRGDFLSLKNILIKLVQSEEKRRWFGQKAFETYNMYFSHSKQMTVRCEQVYEKFLKR